MRRDCNIEAASTNDCMNCGLCYDDIEEIPDGQLYKGRSYPGEIIMSEHEEWF